MGGGEEMEFFNSNKKWEKKKKEKSGEHHNAEVRWLKVQAGLTLAQNTIPGMDLRLSDMILTFSSISFLTHKQGNVSHFKDEINQVKPLAHNKYLIPGKYYYDHC